MDVMAVVKSPPLRMKRKCGTPGCTLEDFHLGPCTLDNKVNDDGGRAKREVKPVKEEEPPAPKGKVEPPWKFQTELDELGAGGPIRRRPPRRAPLMTAAERREAAVATDFLAKWSAQEEELFALGRMLYGKDLRRRRHPAAEQDAGRTRRVLLPAQAAGAAAAVVGPPRGEGGGGGRGRTAARGAAAPSAATTASSRGGAPPPAAPRRCAGGASTTRALVPKGHTESVKNAWWRWDACVTTLCEATPKGSAVHGAHGVCASCVATSSRPGCSPTTRGSTRRCASPASALSAARVPW